MRSLSRRAFNGELAALAACLSTFCLTSTVNAEPAPPRRVGIILAAYSQENKEVQALRQGLLEAGYAEGRDVVLEWHYLDANYDLLPGAVADLVHRKVAVIVVTSTLVAQTVKRATSTIPIVMAQVADPLGSGLVSNLARPGENITGLSTMTTDLSAKRLQLLKEAVPEATRVAVLWNPATPWHRKVIEDIKAVAPSLSIDLSFVIVQTAQEIGPAFSAIARAHADALYVIAHPVFYTHQSLLLKLALEARLPAIYWQRNFVDQGGLMSYGTNAVELYRRSAWYVDKILKGAKPGDLPIEQPNKFDLVINLKTAKALGITIPESILLRADEVIR